MVYGAAVPTLLSSMTGLVKRRLRKRCHRSPALSTTATSTSPVGASTITAAQGTLAAANYNFALVNGVVAIYGGGRR
jgi:hypothetical protein